MSILANLTNQGASAKCSFRSRAQLPLYALGRDLVINPAGVGSKARRRGGCAVWSAQGQAEMLDDDPHRRALQRVISWRPIGPQETKP